MNAHYQTLFTIYEIAKADQRPEIYPCRPREIILRLMLSWDVIQQHINLLQSEGLITTRQLDTLVIHITGEGLNKIRSLTGDKQSA